MLATSRNLAAGRTEEQDMLRQRRVYVSGIFLPPILAFCPEASSRTLHWYDFPPTSTFFAGLKTAGGTHWKLLSAEQREERLKHDFGSLLVLYKVCRRPSRVFELFLTSCNELHNVQFHNWPFIVSNMVM